MGKNVVEMRKNVIENGKDIFCKQPPCFDGLKKPKPVEVVRKHLMPFYTGSHYLSKKTTENFPYPFPGVAEQPGEWLKEALPAQGLFFVERSSTPSAKT